MNTSAGEFRVVECIYGTFGDDVFEGLGFWEYVGLCICVVCVFVVCGSVCLCRFVKPVCILLCGCGFAGRLFVC